MRHHYLPKGKPANEGIDTSIDTGRRVLSLEEEIVALDEATQLHAEVAAGVEEAARVEDVSENLLVIADTSENIQCLTEEQAALIDTAAEMGVAGTEVDPDAVIPSMEAYIGQDLRLVVEGWRETARDIWNNIRDFVETLWVKIREFWNQIFSVFPRQLARIKQLRELVAQKKKDGAKEPKAKDLALVVGASALSYPGYLVKNVKELQGGLNDLKRLGDWVFGQYTQSVKHQGDIVAGELKSFKPAEAAKTLQSARKKLVSANFTDVIKAPSNGFMGCFDVKARRIEPKKSAELSDAQVLNALRHTYVEVVTTTRGVVLKNTLVTPSLQEIDTTLNAVENLVKMAASFETSSNHKAMDATKQAMKAAGDAASAAWASEGDKLGQAEGAFALDVMKSLMNFNTVYTNWSARLPGEYIKRLMNATRSSLAFCDRAIAQY
jgi:hypothetical protein